MLVQQLSCPCVSVLTKQGVNEGSPGSEPRQGNHLLCNRRTYFKDAGSLLLCYSMRRSGTAGCSVLVVSLFDLSQLQT